MTQLTQPMPITIYDSMSGQKRPFTPLEAGKVGMYVCGMTVYDYCHIGHARVMVGFDVVVRWLRHIGYDVNYVRNITDIDDKIINRAKDNGESIYQLTDRFIKAMHEDADNLGCERPNSEPKATDFIPQMQHLIQTLESKNLAYQGATGDVYYAVENFAEYGKLSKRRLADMQAGASERVNVETDKKNPFDFVLWKSAKQTESQETKWQSPWGVGRPGWHIECSAMSTCCLGDTFDIHGGGHDLQFPHHENEIAQSEGATGKTYANNWMHVGFINVDGEKMSKSLGNFFTIRDVMRQFHPETIRFFILSSHYRSPVNFSDTALKESEKKLSKVYYFRKDCVAFEGQYWWEIKNLKVNHRKIERLNEFFEVQILLNDFKNAMCDDFNTPKAIAVLFQTIKLIKKIQEDVRNFDVRFASSEYNFESFIFNYLRLMKDFNFMTEVLNISAPNKDGSHSKRKIIQFIKNYENSVNNGDGLIDEQIDDLIEVRLKAKADKDFAKADQIRNDLKSQGIELEDGKNGTTWRRV